MEPEGFKTSIENRKTSEGDPKELSPESIRLESKNLELIVQTVRDFKENGLIGGCQTHVAIKDHKSFLIGTYGKGIEVFENDILIPSRIPIEVDNELLNTIYCPPLDCYFLATKTKLFRKDINNKPAYLYMSVKCGTQHGACLRYSKILQRVIINKDGTSISMINPSTRKIELVLKKSFREKICNFCLFGEGEGKVAAVSWDGDIVLFTLNGLNTRGAAEHYKAVLHLYRGEVTQAIAVCEKNKFALVEIGNHFRNRSSRMLILELTPQDQFTPKVSIDIHDQAKGSIYDLESFGYVGEHILWVGLSSTFNGEIRLFEYRPEEGQLRELEEKSVSHQEEDLWRLHRLGNKFYYTGSQGKLMSLIIST